MSAVIWRVRGLLLANPKRGARRIVKNTVNETFNDASAENANLRAKELLEDGYVNISVSPETPKPPKKERPKPDPKVKRPITEAEWVLIQARRGQVVTGCRHSTVSWPTPEGNPRHGWHYFWPYGSQCDFHAAPTVAGAIKKFLEHWNVGNGQMCEQSKYPSPRSPEAHAWTREQRGGR